MHSPFCEPPLSNKYKKLMLNRYNHLLIQKMEVQNNNNKSHKKHVNSRAYQFIPSMFNVIHSAEVYKVSVMEKLSTVQKCHAQSILEIIHVNKYSCWKILIYLRYKNWIVRMSDKSKIGSDFYFCDPCTSLVLMQH